MMWNARKSIRNIIGLRSLFAVALHLTVTSCHGRDRMVVGFTTICVISAYHH